MADPDNAHRWQQRPAVPEQLDQLAFYGEPIVPGLSHSAAAKRIDEICEADPTKADAWDDEISRRELAELALNDIIELAPDYVSDNGCRRLPKKLARQALQAIMAEGITAEQIDRQFYGPLFQRAAKIDPSIVKDTDRFTRQVLKVSKSQR
jgi:hypothetical protein